MSSQDNSSSAPQGVFKYPASVAGHGCLLTALDSFDNPEQHPKRLNGCYGPELLFGVPPPADFSTSGYLEMLEESGRLAYIKSIINDPTRFNLDTSQKDACLQALTNRKGCLAIQGAPGTGKTSTLIALIVAVAESCRKVLVCGSTDSAVDALVGRMIDLTESNVLSKSLGASWNVLKEIYTRSTPIKPPSAAQRLRLEQEMQPIEYDRFTKYAYCNRRYQFMEACRRGAPNVADDVFEYYNDRIEYWDQLSEAEREDFNVIELALDQNFVGRGCRVIFCPLDMSTDYRLKDNFKPNLVIIDEAGSASLADAAIPILNFQKSMKMVVVAGDPKQQPPAPAFGYSDELHHYDKCSLLNVLDLQQDRLLDRRIDTAWLDTQYRMHPQISRYANLAYYNARVRDDGSTEDADAISETIDHAFSGTFEYLGGDRPHYRMGIHVGTQSNQAYGNAGMYNQGEADAVVQLVKTLLGADRGEFGRKLRPDDIMIITPYDAQRETIFETLYTEGVRAGCPTALQVPVMTVATVHGKEAPIVICSLTTRKKQEPERVDYALNDAEINVELTRAQRALFIFGGFSTWLAADSADYPDKYKTRMRHLLRLAKDLQEQGDLIDVDVLGRCLAATEVGEPIA